MMKNSIGKGQKTRHIFSFQPPHEARRAMREALDMHTRHHFWSVILGAMDVNAFVKDIFIKKKLKIKK